MLPKPPQHGRQSCPSMHAAGVVVLCTDIGTHGCQHLPCLALLPQDPCSLSGLDTYPCTGYWGGVVPVLHFHPKLVYLAPRS